MWDDDDENALATLGRDLKRPACEIKEVKEAVASQADRSVVCAGSSASAGSGSGSSAACFTVASVAASAGDSSPGSGSGSGSSSAASSAAFVGDSTAGLHGSSQDSVDGKVMKVKALREAKLSSGD